MSCTSHHSFELKSQAHICTSFYLSVRNRERRYAFSVWNHRTNRSEIIIILIFQCKWIILCVFLSPIFYLKHIFIGKYWFFLQVAFVVFCQSFKYDLSTYDNLQNAACFFSVSYTWLFWSCFYSWTIGLCL